MIGIIDYGMGNLRSVKNSLTKLGAESFVSDDPRELLGADKLILPGVGAFEQGIMRLREKRLDEVLYQAVKDGKPILGICLGMQLLFDQSMENGNHKGLGIINGIVKPLEITLKVPHMGWNNIIQKKSSPLFKRVSKNPYVYFVHSYHVETEDKWVIATTIYEKEIQIAVQKENVFGLQFHPEKSGVVGLNMLKGFLEIEEGGVSL